MIPSSYLRVYEPLDSFSPREKQRWQAYVEAGARLPSTISYRDVNFGPQGTGMIHPLVAEHAFVKRVNGRWLICPWRVKLRMLVGLLAFRNTLPGDVADAFVPETHAERAILELEKLRQSQPDIRANIASAPWHVPLRWFVAFDDSEKLMTIENDKIRVRYETDLATALERVERGTRILQQAGMNEGVVEAVRELGDWLKEFSSESLLELDYASVADLFREEDLENDRSSGEVWSSLEALEVGDYEESGQRYFGLVEWWSRVQSLQSSN
jgi:hypothetical protein